MYATNLVARKLQLTAFYSCEDQNTTQSTIGRRTKAWLAAIWEGMVRRMYDFNNWELSKSWHTFVARYSSPVANEKLKCVGFVAFDQYKTLLQDEAGNISGPRTVIAGFGAGITESLLAVTPFESIKTTLYVPWGGRQATCGRG